MRASFNVFIMKIYTKTGDKGETGLVSGNRVSKGDQRIELYGEVDELNSAIGFLNTLSNDSFIEKVQIELFNLGSLLACESSFWETYKLPKLSPSIISELEKKMDLYSKDLPKLKNFILPGGNEKSSRAHLCRTITRRVERKLIRFEDIKPIHSIEFLNRLSDYFFVLARYYNYIENVEEVIWKPNT